MEQVHLFRPTSRIRMVHGVGALPALQRSKSGCVLAAVLLLGLPSLPAAPVAVVRGTFTASRNAASAQDVASACTAVTNCLLVTRVPFDELRDEDVAAGKLSGYAVAILPYNEIITRAESRELARFVDEGGKVIAFYSLPEVLRERFGMNVVRFLRADPPGRFAAMEFRSGRVAGVPERVQQAVGHIHVAQITTPQTRILAEWVDAAGRRTGYPAWVLSPHGAWMSHVLTPRSQADKQQMLLALIGQHVPEVWEKPALSALSRIGQLDGHHRLETLATALEGRGDSAGVRRRVRRALELAERAREEGYNLAMSRDFAGAYLAAGQARRWAEEAFYRGQHSRQGEFRGVWMHAGTGIQHWNWDSTVRVLHENGFNALFANLLWAGRAYYPSPVMQAAGAATTRRDWLAECLDACREHDVALHLWKVNFNLANAAPEFVAQLRAAGRTQQSRTGQDIDWLCPSHPLNFVLERDSMLEVMRQYDVAGLHFDYIRYPNASACYCAGCKSRFEQWTGCILTNYPADAITGPHAPAFKQWRRDLISRVVYAVSSEARRIRPQVRISAAVFGDWDDCRHTVGQDWKAWVEAGWLDFVCPMNYETNHDAFAALVRHQVQWVQKKVPLYIGIGAWRLASAEPLLPFIRTSRELGADGFVLFQHDARLATEILPALRWGVTREPPAELD